jgi:Asp-tRNA(Asn)/Glu-tRNA(Gln) amidotransferase A subunit family amidase
MSDFSFRGANELAGLMRRLDISSRKLTDRYLWRIDQPNPKFRPVVILDSDGGCTRAGAADSTRWPAAGRGDPLQGRPITVRGAFETAGVCTAAGAPMFSGHIPSPEVYLPSTGAPLGVSADGLPVGATFVAAYLQDRTNIDIARKLADVISGTKRPPGC